MGTHCPYDVPGAAEEGRVRRQVHEPREIAYARATGKLPISFTDPG